MTVHVSRRRVLAATAVLTGLAGCGDVLGTGRDTPPPLDWMPADATDAAGATEERETADTAFGPGPVDRPRYVAVRVAPVVDAALLDPEAVTPTTVTYSGQTTTLGFTTSNVDWYLGDAARLTADVWAGDVPVEVVAQELLGAGYQEVDAHRGIRVFAFDGGRDAFAVDHSVVAQWVPQYGEDPVAALEALLDAGVAGEGRLTTTSATVGRLADLLGEGDLHYVVPPLPAAEYHTSTISRAATGPVAFGRRLDLHGDVGRWRQAYVVGAAGSLDRHAYVRPRDSTIDGIPGITPDRERVVRDRRLRFEDDAAVIDYETVPVETDENERPGTGKRTRTASATPSRVRPATRR